MATVIEQVIDFWCNSHHSDDFKATLARVVERAVAEDEHGIMLSHDATEYSQQDSVNYLQVAANVAGVEMSSFRKALMWVYPDGAEYKTENRNRFRDL